MKIFLNFSNKINNKKKFSGGIETLNESLFDR